MRRGKPAVLVVMVMAGISAVATCQAAPVTTNGPETKAAIVRNLRPGTSGDDVKTMQTILIQDGDYPEGLITGFFGKLTRQAVIRFQEKYADEILKPNGLEYGTGIVGFSTRAKLNSFFRSEQSNETPRNARSAANLAACLPAGIKLDDVVDARLGSNAQGAVAARKTTVAEKLAQLNASCGSENKLVDGNGKQIYFYHLTGCWGNPPADYNEIMQRQRDEIAKLREKYTVIEMTCNPSGAMIM